MAIKLPEYGGSRVSTAKRSPDTRMNDQGTVALSRAHQKLGNVMAQWGAKLTERHNNAVTAQSFNSFRDDARQKISELQMIEGAEPGSLTREYDSWYQEKSGEYKGKLLGVQKDMFPGIANSRRANDLDSLVRHEAVQHRKFIANSHNKIVIDAERDAILAAEDTEKSNDLIKSTKLSLQAIHGSEADISADLERVDGQLKVVMIQELIESRPELAAGRLEEWKDSLGGAYTKLKARLDQELEIGKRDNAYKLLREMHGQDYGEMNEKLLSPEFQKAHGLEVEDVAYLTQRIETEFQQSENIREMKNSELNKDLWDTIATGVIEHDIRGAYKAIDKADHLRPMEKLKMRQWIKDQLKMQASGKEDDRTETMFYLAIKEGKITKFDEILQHKDMSKLSVSALRRLEHEFDQKGNYGPLFSIYKKNFQHQYQKDNEMLMKYPAFEDIIRKEIQDLEETEKRPATFSEVNEIFQSWLDVYEKPRNWWPDKETTRFEEEMEARKKETEAREKWQKGEQREYEKSKYKIPYAKLPNTGNQIQGPAAQSGRTPQDVDPFKGVSDIPLPPQYDPEKIQVVNAPETGIPEGVLQRAVSQGQVKLKNGNMLIYDRKKETITFYTKEELINANP